MVSKTVADILTGALECSTDERALIAETLLVSIEAPAGEGMEAAWQTEIDRRWRDLRDSRSSAIPWEQVRDRLVRNASVSH